MDMDTDCIISHMMTLHNIHMNTNIDMNMEYIISHMETLHGVYIHMECQSTWSGGHCTLCNIHMDTDIGMDTEYGSTWSVETLYIQ